MRHVFINPGRYKRLTEGEYHVGIPCAHLGERTEQQASCTTCAGRVSLKLHTCDIHRVCSPSKDVTGAPCCLHCGNYTPSIPDIDQAAPRCGVVVGSYGYPLLVELQIKVIRDTCGNVPILISDDRSPNGGEQRIAALAQKFPDVSVIISDARIGHSGGDMAAFFRGLQWADCMGLQCLAKLSHRFILQDPRWLQVAAMQLLASGKAVGGQPCEEGEFIFPLRTEAVILDVQRWHTSPIIHHLLPRPLGIACEAHVWQAVETWLGGQLWNWPVITPDRFLPTPNVLWHVCTADAEYHALASRYGITLDPDFNAAGNHLRQDYIVG